MFFLFSIVLKSLGLPPAKSFASNETPSAIRLKLDSSWKPLVDGIGPFKNQFSRPSQDPYELAEGQDERLYITETTEKTALPATASEVDRLFGLASPEEQDIFKGIGFSNIQNRVSDWHFNEKTGCLKLRRHRGYDDPDGDRFYSVGISYAWSNRMVQVNWFKKTDAISTEELQAVENEIGKSVEVQCGNQ